jgi:predicted nucleotidyltransferase
MDKKTKIQIKEITKRIVNSIDPNKIILFGSYAYGTANKSSDLDLLVVVKKAAIPATKERERLEDIFGELRISQKIFSFIQKMRSKSGKM